MHIECYSIILYHHLSSVHHLRIINAPYFLFSPKLKAKVNHKWFWILPHWAAVCSLSKGTVIMNFKIYGPLCSMYLLRESPWLSRHLSALLHNLAGGRMWTWGIPPISVCWHLLNWQQMTLLDQVPHHLAHLIFSSPSSPCQLTLRVFIKLIKL